MVVAMLRTNSSITLLRFTALLGLFCCSALPSGIAQAERTTATAATTTTTTTAAAVGSTQPGEQDKQLERGFKYLVENAHQQGVFYDLKEGGLEEEEGLRNLQDVSTDGPTSAPTAAPTAAPIAPDGEDGATESSGGSGGGCHKSVHSVGGILATVAAVAAVLVTGAMSS